MEVSSSLDRASLPTYRSYESSLSAAAEVSEKQTGEITITTAEGDRVTLSRSTAMSASYALYDRAGRTEDSAYRERAESFSMQAASSFSMSVEGNLSKDELKDIMKAVHGAEKAMEQLARGHVKSAVKFAEDFQKLDTLSGLEAEVAIERSAALSYAEVVQQDAGEAPAEPALQPETGEQEDASETASTAAAAPFIELPGVFGSLLSRLLKSEHAQASGRPEHNAKADRQSMLDRLLEMQLTEVDSGAPI